MSIALKPTESIKCQSEYDYLARVIVCEPQYMSISEVINETQRHYARENINRSLASTQHKEFVHALRNQGVEVVELKPDQQYPEQVFTRDIGFTIDSTVFLCNMGSTIRKGEEEILKKWLISQKVNMQPLPGTKIEGGDVVADRENVFVGVSGRTSNISIKALQQHLPEKNVMAIPFDKKYLHLDCVFNILSPKEALIYPPAFQEKELDILSKMYDLIEVSQEEQFTLGTNVLSIGNKKVFSLPFNKKVNRKLRERGYEVIEVDLSEIIKSGGSFRCCTLPLVRYSN
ncbi:dimethylarginine dimethylaminohydrolase family protein [Fictibacillus fluitans]|uniref:Dimethylarginine dimethylaminohydrolase family protein n=1 Tax=Fictibacillus fluitans TaxID=3058422 RepID=A0ABT8HV21_9BACL|nr:dimethylarginine dimethylaminohydrolase family protein [Fictibacillus sp. NE201]MDN4524620.1 dimethylarginine dimethylaminohydrolase family protein [Fictibacillus sp. NE201]